MRNFIITVRMMIPNIGAVFEGINLVAGKFTWQIWELISVSKLFLNLFLCT